MDATTCLTNTTWERYAQGTLSAKEEEMLLAHVNTCAICADIKDGIDLMADKTSLSKHINNINQQIDERVNKQPIVRSIRPWYAVAAACMLVALVGIAVYQNKYTPIQESSIALKSESPSDTAPVLPAPSAPVKPEELPEVKPSSRRSKPMHKEIKEKPLLSDNQVSIAAPASDAVTAIAEDLPKLEEKSKEQEADQTQTKTLSAPIATESVTKEALTVTKRKAWIQSKSPSATYPSNYNVMSNTQLNQLEGMDTGWVQLALNYYNQQQWDSCALVAKPYLLSGQNNTKAYALYWTAKSVWKKGNNALAKRYLRECIEESNVLKKEAEQLLKEIP